MTRIFLALALVAVSLTAQTTLQVPAQHATIQGAIVAASPGDVVEVAPGVYSENIDFLGKDLTVRGAAGAAATIIDGSAIGPVASFTGGESQAAVLEGVTLRNGKSLAHGGGVHCNGASPTIISCVIESNTTRDGCGHSASCGSTSVHADHGGGLYLAASSAILSGCTIRNTPPDEARTTRISRRSATAPTEVTEAASRSTCPRP